MDLIPLSMVRVPNVTWYTRSSSYLQKTYKIVYLWSTKQIGIAQIRFETNIAHCKRKVRDGLFYG